MRSYEQPSIRLAALQREAINMGFSLADAMAWAEEEFPKRYPTAKGPVKRYGPDGMRLTNCCGAYSTYMEDPDRMSFDLCCKACWEPVGVGEGDGAEYKPGTHPDGEEAV